MILDTLSRADLYANMHPRLREAFDQLKRKDLAALPLGRNTIKPYLHIETARWRSTTTTSTSTCRSRAGR